MAKLVVDLVDGYTDAARAAEIKAQADIIAQQERLIRCRTTPSTCVSAAHARFRLTRVGAIGSPEAIQHSGTG